MEGAGTGNANSTVILSQRDGSPFSLGPEAEKNAGRVVEKKQKRKTEVRKRGKTKYPIEIKRKCVSGVSIWGSSRGQWGGHSENKKQKTEMLGSKGRKAHKSLGGLN